MGVLEERGHDAVVLARSRGVDLLTGGGLPAALAGADAVIDVSNVTTTRTAASVAFFSGATRTLLEAERVAGVAHHVALTIVGAESAPEGYYAGKLAQERLVSQGPVPWTVLRATQFHDFAATMYAALGIGPMHAAPRARVQPVAVREVAQRLVAHAESAPAPGPAQRRAAAPPGAELGRQTYAEWLETLPTR